MKYITPEDHEEIAKLRTGEISELSEGCMGRLFEHYLSTGEMPYGTAKARTGDPDEWIYQQLEKESV